MEDIWFTSDTHFHHKSIMNFCRETRLGADYEEMTELLVQAWNSRVKKTDRIYHMGDFSFGNREKTLETISRLNGNIHLVLGNHDKMLESPSFDKCFESKQIYKTINIGEHRVVMMHYPIESYDRMRHGSLHFHGHLHGDNHHNCTIIKNRIDVGVDTRKQKDMAPYHFDELLDILKERDG
jgi:calcineurin-like phosphoesterase family protein